jgi:hypothetical protein
MANFNDYNKQKLGTSNGTQTFPPVNLLKNKIPDVFPSDPSESASADIDSELVTNSNLIDYLSYKHDLVTIHGLIEVGEGGAIFSPGSILKHSPLKDSLGGVYTYSSNKAAKIARELTGKVGGLQVQQPVASSGKFYGIAKDPVPLPQNYNHQGLTDIQFSTTSILSSENNSNTNSVLNNQYISQFILLYGNTDMPNPAEGIPLPEIGFEKFRLGLLSLFYNLEQKRNSWTYYYPTVTNGGSTSILSNTKNISFPFNGNKLSYDRTINDNQFTFLLDLFSSDPNNYQKEISAMAYQLLVGGGFGATEVVSFDTLPAGVGKRIYSDLNYDLNIPVSEEMVSFLDEGGFNNIDQDTLVADMKPVYNFTITNYHQAMPLIPEIRIPNVYVAAKNGVQGIFQGLKIDDPDVDLSNYKIIPFFEKLATQFLNCDEDEQTVYANPEYTKLMNIVWDKGAFTTDVEQYKEMFPMYVEVEFDCNPNKDLVANELLDNLYKNKMVEEYIRTMLSFFYGPESETLAAMISQDFEKLESGYTSYGLGLNFLNYMNVADTAYLAKASTLIKESLLQDRTGTSSLTELIPKIMDFNRWMEVYEELLVGTEGFGQFQLVSAPNYSNYTTFLGFDESIGGLNTTLEANFVRALYYSAAKDFYKNQVLALSRTIDKILNGAKAASIPLFYVIEKTEQETGKFIQNIIIPATATTAQKSGKFKYIDTQVKYNKSYSYSIKAHCLVVGSTYRYQFETTTAELELATQVGYGKIKKEDIIFAKVTNSLAGTNEYEYGDAFNYAGDFEIQTQDGTENALFLTEDQIQAFGGKNLLSAIGDYSEEDYQILQNQLQLSINNQTVMASIKPYYAFAEASSIKGVPAYPGKVNQISDANLKFTIYDVGDHAYVYIDPDTLMPTSNVDPDAIKVNLDYEDYAETGQYSLTLGEKTYVLEVNGNLGTVVSSEEIEASTEAQILNSNKKLCIVRASLYSKVKIIETPYFEEQYVRILDNPPITPIVNFYPYKDVRNSLLITFENQTGDYEDAPINILPGDGQVFLNIRKAQKKMLRGVDGSYIFVNLRFRSDDFASEYQVFRIRETRPSSYADFSNALYQVVNVRERTAFIDKLETNVKYYYVFRTIDLHQNLSNPSYLYEVEMVENSGVTFPIINVVDFAAPPKDFGSRFFGRYLKIEPALGQKVVNEEASGVLGGGTGINPQVTPKRGIRQESIWNQKKFKFRIKSVNTGKAIDLNVKFKTNHKQPDPIDSCE